MLIRLEGCLVVSSDDGCVELELLGDARIDATDLHNAVEKCDDLDVTTKAVLHNAVENAIVRQVVGNRIRTSW